LPGLLYFKKCLCTEHKAFRRTRKSLWQRLPERLSGILKRHLFSAASPGSGALTTRKAWIKEWSADEKHQLSVITQERKLVIVPDQTVNLRYLLIWPPVAHVVFLSALPVGSGGSFRNRSTSLAGMIQALLPCLSATIRFVSGDGKPTAPIPQFFAACSVVRKSIVVCISFSLPM